jgi:hypothetical protein
MNEKNWLLAHPSFKSWISRWLPPTLIELLFLSVLYSFLLYCSFSFLIFSIKQHQPCISQEHLTWIHPTITRESQEYNLVILKSQKVSQPHNQKKTSQLENLTMPPHEEAKIVAKGQRPTTPPRHGHLANQASWLRSRTSMSGPHPLRSCLAARPPLRPLVLALPSHSFGRPWWWGHP